MEIKIKFDKTKQFKKDVAKLKKKFRSIESDLKTLKKSSIKLFHPLRNTNNNGIFEINGIGNTDKIKFFKVKKIACKSLKGRGAKSGLRLIYAYLPQEEKIVFIELYFKANQKNESRKRIYNFLNKEIKN